MTAGDERIGRWHPGERLVPSVSRALVVQMDRAVGALEESGTPPGLVIHTTRKAIKRSRALLRLLRDLLGPDAFRKDNVALRDVGRQLAELRDAAVVVDTLDLHRTDLETAVGAESLIGIRFCVVAALESQGDATALRSEAAGALGAARARFKRLTVDSADGEFVAFAAGLRRVYRNGRKAMRGAAVSGRVREFHEWRKRVKYLRYQLEHLGLVEPEIIAGAIAQLRHVDELLGNAHDLWLLAGSIEDCCPDPGQRAAVVDLAETKRHHLEGTALQAGQPFYTDKPGAFVNQLGSYWQALPRN